MPAILINYFQTVAAFLLALDFTFHLTLALPVLLLAAVSLLRFYDISNDGFLRVVRAVCRIE